ncbi:MAG: hypothetical protein JNJ97_15665 [Alphaproteobacteria bacterium]|nr:hypothetical protein [Alphaproteobacteria bacterium]MCA0450846.1 hypothetical protein [Pseudomonadota bacterium]
MPPNRIGPILLFLAGHMLIGIAVGWSILGALLWFDIGGLWRLIGGSAHMGIVLTMLLIGFAITFGSVAMGSAIVALEEDRKGPGGRGFRVRLLRRLDGRAIPETSL